MRLPTFYSRMPDFPRGFHWFNAKPMTKTALLGKVVLIDFFTLSCATCERGRSWVDAWRARYGRRGLVTIGIHVPEFAFERSDAYIESMLKERGITFPVVHDGKYILWNAYKNRIRPGRYVVDAQGKIVYRGDDGDGVDTERAIRDALRAAGKHLPELPEQRINEESCHRLSPDVHLGYLHGSLGNADDLLPAVESAFTDNGVYKDDVPYLHGHWRVTKEFVEHARSLPVATEYLAIRYSAFALHAVLESSTLMTVEVRLDEQPVPESMRGDALVLDGEKTVMQIGEARIYEIIRSSAYHRGTLKFLVASAGLRCYVISTENCQTG
ncbi:MAG: Redoxin domain-containing protein [Candidatus Uhrbacteria bacterium GW2011_GWD2_52_7]|uniref:Redoxin domain-containing protein n=1 Tax=Candidatus Uhrbacteria bacterium GW2011_GWD2_52_7 TaxID=1618989 RepID=A0A0G1ZN03_9BACT|nr:MAG: Redoxin domain-containing protein [Candidatus Uhrbacteria bacterium GW2011_GWD2_52_7]